MAGDIALGEHFLAAIRPFIWRKYLDFAAISDIHAMKRQIDAQTGGKGLLGLDVKRGRGGIREIEFIVQTLGLVWGGQDPALRIPATLTALPAMAKAGHLPEKARASWRPITACCARWSTGCKWWMTARPMLCPPPRRGWKHSHFPRRAGFPAPLSRAAGARA